jgi:hypothetical protein
MTVGLEKYNLKGVSQMRIKNITKILILLIAAVVLTLTLANFVYAEAGQNDLQNSGVFNTDPYPSPNPCLDPYPYPGPYECDYMPMILKVARSMRGLFGE